jgi:MoxR-like ATPase
LAEARPLPRSVDEVVTLLAEGRYVAGRGLATALFLSLRLARPLLVEGEPGVGKTEIAKVVAERLDRRLIRLQCYEGLDVASAVYEWSYARQMLEIRLAEAAGLHDKEAIAKDVFSESFLVRRPLLQALESDPRGPPVLLVDEIDRTDEPFEAYLLEVLSEFQVTVPELGPVRAAEPPIVVLTSNRTREIHDALKRRCFYHFIDYPTADEERAIVKTRLPDASAELSAQVVAFVQRLRTRDLMKPPGVAESLDWVSALAALDQGSLSRDAVESTLGVLLKYQDDIDKIRGAEVDSLLAEAAGAGTAPT